MASDGSQPWAGGAGGGAGALARLPGHGGQQPAQNYGQLRAAAPAPGAAKGGYGKHGDYDPAAQPGSAVYAAPAAAHPHGGYVPSGPIGRFMAPAYVPPSQRPAAAAAAAPAAAAAKHGAWTERGKGTWYAPPSAGNKKVQFKASRAITAAAPLSAPRVYDPRAERRYAMLRDGSKMPLLAVPVARPADAAARLDEGWDHLDVTPLLGRAAAAGADGERVDLGGRDRGSFFAYASCGMGPAGEGPGPAEVGALPAALGVAALDLALLHKPPAVEADAAGFEQLFLDAWQALEALVEAGRVTTLGLGGFDERELAAVLPLCKVRPAVLQAELHPLHSQRRLAGFCRRQGIELMSCAPLAGGAPELLEDPAVREVAAAHGVSAEVAALKYCVHRGIAALVPAAAAAEARQVWTFGLVGAEKAALDKLDRQRAFCACCHKQ